MSWWNFGTRKKEPMVKQSKGICDKQKDIIDAIAHRLLGVKYKLGAEVSFDTPVYQVKFIDCSELIQYIFSKIDIMVPDGSWNQHSASFPIEPKASQCGDLAFKHRDGKICHVGLIVFESQVIEAGPRGQVIKRPLEAFMRNTGAKSKFDTVRSLRLLWKDGKAEAQKVGEIQGYYES